MQKMFSTTRTVIVRDAENKSQNAPTIVTTALAEESGLKSRAVSIAGDLNLAFVKRDNKGLKKLASENGAFGVIVVSKQKISYYHEGMEFFFHPGMAKLRIKEMIDGKNDQMVKSMDIHPGDTILDCTMGLGSDALVASFATGPGGRVTGLENSVVIEYLVRLGLSDLAVSEETPLGRAAGGIVTLNVNHEAFLESATDSSYDIVYFDPMFRQCIEGSPAMDAMRPLTDSSPLSRRVVEEAFRICRRRVVLKEKKGSREFERLGFERIVGGKYSPVSFGIIDKRGGGHG